MFIGELSVLDNSPFWHFDEEFCKWHISNHNLKREPLPQAPIPENCFSESCRLVKLR